MSARIHATVLGTAAVLMALAPSAASAAGTVTVSTTADNVAGSLRDVIAHAAPGDKIIVPAGTYTLMSGELGVPRSVTIAGAGAASTFIDGQKLFRVFHTTGFGNQITISGVTIRNGKATPSLNNVFAQGGGVMNEQATLTLSDDVIRDNVVSADGAQLGNLPPDAEGGGVYSAGTLNLVNSDVRGNLATANGGAGQAGGSALGGGIESIGATAVRGSTFEINTATARGDTHQNGGTAQGGGLVLAQLGPTSISATTLRDNIADASAGQGASRGTASGGGALMDNDSNGGITETNVTYVGNIARATGAQSQGGGLALVGQSAGQSLTNVTLSGNVATAGTANQGGDVFVGTGASATFENTVVAAGGADPGSENCFLAGTLSSLGHNIESRDQCNFRASGDLTRTDALLGTLSDNGGPVATVPLKPGSPAIDAGAGVGCPSSDARGVLRPAGGGCDVGAFEVATPSASTGHASAVAANSAVVAGTVSNPDLGVGTAFFQFGTTTGYGSSTPAQPVGARSVQQEVTARLGGLAPGTTYHFRVVVRNATGTVTGADETLTTSPTPPGPPRVKLRSVAIAGATATVRIACVGVAGQRCTGTARGTTRVRRRGGSIISLSADSRSKRRPSVRVRTVTVATSSFSVLAGRTATLRITANATGKQLLARFYRLPAGFVFSTSPVRVSRAITFAYQLLKSRVNESWTWTFPPCAPCVTSVQQMMVTLLPSGARIALSCHGPGCPFDHRALRPRRAAIDLTGLFAHSRLQTGTRLEVRVTAPNRVGVALAFTMRTATFPRITTRCLPPGARAPAACRTRT